jgi:hypothetical protein
LLVLFPNTVEIINERFRFIERLPFPLSFSRLSVRKLQ